MGFRAKHALKCGDLAPFLTFARAPKPLRGLTWARASAVDGAMDKDNASVRSSAGHRIVEMNDFGVS